jgi:predicted transcriptional regulator
MKSALISINPEFVKKIIAGSKTIELRRRFFVNPKNVEHLYIYCTAPVKSVVARTKIQKIEKISVDTIVRDRSADTGIDAARVKKYFSGVEFGFAIWLHEVEVLSESIPIEDLGRFGLSRPPQSYSFFTASPSELNPQNESVDRHKHYNSFGGYRSASPSTGKALQAYA